MTVKGGKLKQIGIGGGSKRPVERGKIRKGKKGKRRKKKTKRKKEGRCQ